MHLNVETSRKWADVLPEDVADKYRAQPNFWNVIVRFSSIQCLSDKSYFPGDHTPTSERWRDPTNNNIIYLKSYSLSSPVESNRLETFSIQEWHSIPLL